jgi:hypothetical protein
MSVKLAELESLKAVTSEAIVKLQKELETARAELRQALLREESSAGERDDRASVSDILSLFCESC